MAKTPTFPLIIDRCLTVSIADLKRWGCLKPGNYRSGTVYWERGGEREASDPAILPGMWKHLSEKLDRPFVGETGIYIGNIEKNASPLMALALVLINRNLLKERLKLSQTDIYRVLCKHFEVPFASAPHRARDTNTYDDVLRQADKYFERSK